jgi:hypothetical protein
MFLEDSAQIPSQRNRIPCIRPDVQLSKHHQSRRKELSVRTFLCVQKLRTDPGCIHPDVSATRPDALQCSTSKQISYQNINMGRQLHPSGRHGHFAWTLSLIRQVVQKMFNRSDNILHGPDPQALIWKLCAAKVQLSRH